MENATAKAEWISGRRALLFYIIAAALVISAALGVAAHVSGSRSLVWVVACGLAALNLTPAGTALNRSRVVKSLLNDEGVRQHRLMSFAAGFWATIVTSMIIAVVTTVVPLAPMATAQIITSAGLAAALISFATLERRAARG